VQDFANSGVAREGASGGIQSTVLGADLEGASITHFAVIYQYDFKQIFRSKYA